MAARKLLLNFIAAKTVEAPIRTAVAVIQLIHSPNKTCDKRNPAAAKDKEKIINSLMLSSTIS